MKKMLRYMLWLGVALILLGAVSCHIPFLTPDEEEGGGTTEPTVTPEPSNPEAPANTDGAETILIPAGYFLMGSEANDELADDDEIPLHKVTLNGFYIYTHEVTNEMYAACVDAGACDPVMVLQSGPTTHYADPAYAEFPVVGVDWNNADDYCKWAGGRLPTEAEWERAARGSASLMYPWGVEDPTCDRVNMLGCAVPPDIVTVGSYLLGNSPEGVWDMSGNVWEWVHDWYSDVYYQFSPGFDPLGPYSYQDEDNPLKVVRGGGLFSGPDKMRGAERVGASPYRAYDDVGFRCVTPPGELPAAYIPTRNRHDRVPGGPDGGEHAEDDPHGWGYIAFGERQASCPLPDDSLQISINIESSYPGLTFEVYVEGNHFNCVYDEVAHLLNCTGPVPVTYDSLTEYHIVVHTSLEGVVYEGVIPKPVGCTAPPPDRFSVRLDCPRDGVFLVFFTTEPVITWDITQVGGVDMFCFPGDFPGQVACLAPDVRSGDHYMFYLHGYSADGTEYMWAPWAPVRTDCIGTAHWLDASGFCFEDHPTVQFTAGLDWPALASVSEEGVPLSCFAMAPGVWICGDLTHAAGSTAEVEVCFEGWSCFTPVITVPSCPGDTTTGHTFEPWCIADESGGSIPSLSIHYWPAEQPLTSATVGGVPVTCHEWAPNWYVCPGVTGSPGDMLDASACLADGTCFSGPFLYPDWCSTPPETWGNEWMMDSYGCHDETHIFFQMDTGIDFSAPGADVTSLSATDGETTYSCAPNTASPGKVYCVGPRPTSPGPLTFCYQGTCVGWPTWPGEVASIPACAQPITEVPVVPSCSDYNYTSPTECSAHGCYWHKEDNTCQATP